MSDAKLHEQKMTAQIDELQAEADKLKAKASGASADVQLEMNERLEELQGKMANAKDSLVEGAESAWDSIKTTVGDAASKHKS